MLSGIRAASSPSTKIAFLARKSIQRIQLKEFHSYQRDIILPAFANTICLHDLSETSRERSSRLDQFLLTRRKPFGSHVPTWTFTTKSLGDSKLPDSGHSTCSLEHLNHHTQSASAALTSPRTIMRLSKILLIALLVSSCMRRLATTSKRKHLSFNRA